jgi:hypothetical protein
MMPPAHFRVPGLVAGAVLALAAAPVAAAVNIVPTATIAVDVIGVHGVLRDGSPWGPGSTPSDILAPVDGVFEPEGQQWNNGSFWWDQDSSINPAGPVSWIVRFDAVYNLRRFVLQADDNDSYLLEWWDGAMWQVAWDIAPVFSFGLITRDSGLTGPIPTDRLRITASPGDDYYALSELQAFAVPEPATWGLMIMGFGLAGAALRRQTASTAS